MRPVDTAGAGALGRGAVGSDGATIPDDCDQPLVGSGGGGGVSPGGGGGGGVDVNSDGGGWGWKPPVAEDVQPALRKEGAVEVKPEGGLGGGAGTKPWEDEEDPTVAHPCFVSTGAGGMGADSEFGGRGGISTSMAPDAAWRAGNVDGFAILIPLALAIFLSSFSSRFLSFSFRLSISSFGVIRTLACMSLKRALW